MKQNPTICLKLPVDGVSGAQYVKDMIVGLQRDDQGHDDEHYLVCESLVRALSQLLCVNCDGTGATGLLHHSCPDCGGNGWRDGVSPIIADNKDSVEAIR